MWMRRRGSGRKPTLGAMARMERVAERTRWRMTMAARAIAAASALALGALGAGSATAEGLSQPPYPVILIHGLASDAGTWTALRQALGAQGWEFGGVPTFVPATLGVTDVSPGALYAMSFSDASAATSRAQSLSLARQGYELAAVIQKVLDANPGADKVILVGHSMGGLAAREYLQGLAQLDPSVARIPYRGDVAQLIAIGTPHLGSPLASLCQAQPSACLAIDIDPASVAVGELVPGSPALRELDDVAAHPLPDDVRYDTIAGRGGIGPIADGDGIVPRISQEFLASVPGLTHRLDEVTVQDRPNCGASVGFDNTIVFGEVHTCEPGDVGVWASMVDAMLEPRLSLQVDKAAVSVGDTLTVTLDSQRGFPDPENVGDLYIGALVPDGSVYLLTPGGFALAFSGGAAVPGGLQPLRANAPLPSGREVIFSIPIGAPIPDGQYAFAAVLVKPGSTPEDSANWLSNLSHVSFTFSTSLQQHP